MHAGIACLSTAATSVVSQVSLIICRYLWTRLFVQAWTTSRQTDRQTDIYRQKQHKPTGKNVHHTYETIKTQNHETTYEFTYNSKLSLTSLTARDFCLKTDWHITTTGQKRKQTNIIQSTVFWCMHITVKVNFSHHNKMSNVKTINMK